MLSNIEEAYRTSDWAVVASSTLDVEVHAIGCFRLDFECRSGCVVKVLVQQLELGSAVLLPRLNGYAPTSFAGLEISENGTGIAIVKEGDQTSLADL